MQIVIITIALLAALIACAITKRRWDLLPRILFALVTEAERLYSSGTGALKLAKVIEWILPHIPAIIKPFVTEQTLMRLINAALDAAKIKWSSNPKLISKF